MHVGCLVAVGPCSLFRGEGHRVLGVVANAAAIAIRSNVVASVPEGPLEPF